MHDKADREQGPSRSKNAMQSILKVAHGPNACFYLLKYHSIYHASTRTAERHYSKPKLRQSTLTNVKTACLFTTNGVMNNTDYLSPFKTLKLQSCFLYS